MFYQLHIECTVPAPITRLSFPCLQSPLTQMPPLLADSASRARVGFANSFKYGGSQLPRRISQTCRLTKQSDVSMWLPKASCIATFVAVLLAKCVASLVKLCETHFCTAQALEALACMALLRSFLSTCTMRKESPLVCCCLSTSCN